MNPPRKRILLVDDDEVFLGLLKRSLAPTFDVTTTISGREAKNILEHHAAAFDAVLADLMMPNGTGMELYEWVRKRFPGLAPHMLFLSGGAFTPSAQAFVDDMRHRVLFKPLDLSALDTWLEHWINTRAH